MDEVREYCIDLIKGALNNMPRAGRHEDDIERAKTLSELAHVLCFHLSNWVGYEFFETVVTNFQPQLRSVKDRMVHYEEQLKPLLEQKLEYIAELRQR